MGLPMTDNSQVFLTDDRLLGCIGRTKVVEEELPRVKLLRPSHGTVKYNKSEPDRTSVDPDLPMTDNSQVFLTDGALREQTSGLCLALIAPLSQRMWHVPMFVLHPCDNFIWQRFREEPSDSDGRKRFCTVGTGCPGVSPSDCTRQWYWFERVNVTGPATRARASECIVSMLPSDFSSEPCLVTPARRHFRMFDLAAWARFDCQQKGAMLRSFHPGSATIVEVGAFHGEEIKMFKGLVRKMWTFEPTPAKAEFIRKAIRDAGMTDVVEFRQAAISNFTGTVQLYTEEEDSDQDTVGEAPPWASREEFLRRHVFVPALRLDDAIPIGEHITMLKVDTQGHELPVLQGAERILREDPPEILHLEFSPRLQQRNTHSEPDEMLRLIYSWGYICFDCYEWSKHTIPRDIKLPRDIRRYHTIFPDWYYRGGLHGSWEDIMCFI